MIGKPLGLHLVLSWDMSHLLIGQAQDGDSDKINFLNGVARGRHHKRVRSFPWARFFDGVHTSKKQTATVLACIQCTPLRGVSNHKGLGRAVWAVPKKLTRDLWVPEAAAQAPRPKGGYFL
jgi:sulfur relay (sulfurtransferase) complex TusBCD TusD component (DsrE family)